MVARPSSLALVLVVALVASTSQSSAWSLEQAAEAVPREAMALLLSGPEGLGTRAFDLRVGAAPADFPEDLLPNGALVRVSAGIDGLSAVVAVVARFSSAERMAFEERLAGAGWVNPFQPAGFAPRTIGPSLSVCRGDRFATINFLTRSEGGSYVRASVATEPGRACLAQAPSPVTTPLPLPSMPVPPGARSGRASMGGTPDAMYSSVRLSAPQSVEAIGAHYAAQLTAAGWTLEGMTADGAAMSVTRLRSAGPAGASVTAVLVVTAVGESGEVDVLLRLVQPQGVTGTGSDRR